MNPSMTASSAMSAVQSVTVLGATGSIGDSALDVIARHPDRYRVFAWLAVFPSRTLGTVFFFFAVFVFDQALGYLAGVFLDGSVGIATLFCLLRILRLEQNISEGRQA